MDTLIIMTILNTIASTYFFRLCLKIIDKNRNRKKLHILLMSIFFISYFVVFYFIQSSLPSQVNNWHFIDGVLGGLSSLGFLVALYNVYKRIKFNLIIKNKS